jgi:hypothetical protein
MIFDSHSLQKNPRKHKQDLASNARYRSWFSDVHGLTQKMFLETLEAKSEKIVCFSIGFSHKKLERQKYVIIIFLDFMLGTSANGNRDKTRHNFGDSFSRRKLFIARTDELVNEC